MDAIARQPEASGKSNSYAYRSCINWRIGFAALFAVIKIQKTIVNGWL
jgi:hypothetical protein